MSGKFVFRDTRFKCLKDDYFGMDLKDPLARKAVAIFLMLTRKFDENYDPEKYKYLLNRIEFLNLRHEKLIKQKAEYYKYSNESKSMKPHIWLMMKKAGVLGEMTPEEFLEIKEMEENEREEKEKKEAEETSGGSE